LVPPWIKRALSIAVVAVVLAGSMGYLAVSQEDRVEWWQLGPSLVRFDRVAVGVCYPWLVFDHFLFNLPAGRMFPGVGGDLAMEVFCGGEFFVVRGARGVYVFSLSTGVMREAFYLSPEHVFVGAKRDTVAVYDKESGVVFVKVIKGDSDVAVPLSASPRFIDYDVVQGIPLVAYSVESEEGSSYRLANPAFEVELPLRGSGALLLSGETLYVEHEGVVTVKVLDARRLHVSVASSASFPFRITEMVKLFGDLILARSHGTLLLVDAARKTFEVVGSAVPTPVGYYVPDADTTYVVTRSGIRPAPGYAVGMFSDDAVFTNVASEEGFTAALWPLRTSILVAFTDIDGVMYAGRHAMKLTLPAGAYRLPMGAVIWSGQHVILLDRDEVYYPEASEEDKPVSVPTVKYSVASFPEKYVPLETFSGVESVVVGGNRALLIQSVRAVVYSEYGVSASIPGVWVFGGVGRCVVLYDGASFRLYDFAGNPIASYQYLVLSPPKHVTCDSERGKYYAVLYYDTEVVRVGEDGARSERSDVLRVRDPVSGLTASFGVPVEVSLGEFRYALPPNATNLQVNGYLASWSRAGGLYVLSVKDSAVYVLAGAPDGALFYPLGDYVLAHREGTVEVLPYKSWVVRQCYVDVETDPDATVYVNGKLAGTGSLRVYTECVRQLTIRAEKPHHKPAVEEVLVVRPVTVTLKPVPMTSRVKLEVVAPAGLNITGATVSLDDRAVEWSVGEEKELLAKTYKVVVFDFKPVDVCASLAANITFREGADTLRVPCELTSSVLVLRSRTHTAVEVVRMPEEAVVASVVVLAGETKHVLVQPGVYEVLSKPMEPGYSAKNLTARVGERAVVVLDVTPLPTGRIEVRSNVEYASITVARLDGTVVATGDGTLVVDVEPGEYTVQVSAPGYTAHYEIVEVQAGEIITVEAVLSPLATEVAPPPPPQPLWQRREIQLASILALIVAAALVLLWRRRRRVTVAEAEVTE